MSWFRRVCAIVFVLADLALILALGLTWYGPWTAVASALLNVEQYAFALMVCAFVAALGLVVTLVRALLPGGKVRAIEVAQVDGGTISVTRDAVAAQATHIVEADGTCAAARVRVDALRNGDVDVFVRVLPHETVDVVAKGAELHARLVSGLAAVCGDKVADVSLEFVEPESVTLPEHEDGPAEAPAQEIAPAAEPRPDATSEITVSMGSHGAEREA